MTATYRLLPDDNDGKHLPSSGRQLARLVSVVGIFSFVGGFALCWLLSYNFGVPGRGKEKDHLRISAAAAAAKADESPHIYVDLPQGRIRGRNAIGLFGNLPTDQGRCFLGIPYGTAERWQLPKPRGPWHPRVLDATRFGSSCLRPGVSSTANMSEDCLNLNIYLPPAGQGQEIHGRGVMVWLHGGSFIYESADETHAPSLRELVLTNQLLVVTVEYRLGILGFLASRRLLPAGSSGPIGNFGILDQQLALKWIKENIGHFSGDQQRIAVAGWSAGAASVSVHLSMPSSAGLFQRAIMLSGGFVSWAAQTAAAAELSYDALLKASGCAEVKACLEEGPPCSCLQGLGPEAVVRLDQGYFAAPTVDSTVLPHHPMDPRAWRAQGAIPIIVGSAIEDSFVDIGAAAGSREFEEYLQTVLPNTTMVHKALSLYMTAKSEQNVLQGANVPMHRGWSRYYWAARRVYADSVMTCPARRAARRWREVTGAPAHWYLWGIGREAGAPEWHIGPGMVYPRSFSIRTCSPCPGASHGADQDYLFSNMGHPIQNRVDYLVSTYPALLADFVKRGDPNKWNSFILHASDSSGPAWSTVEHGGMWFQINGTRLSPELRGEVCDFWDALQAS